MAKIGNMPHTLKPTDQSCRGGNGEGCATEPYCHSREIQSMNRTILALCFSIAVGTSMASLASTARIDSVNSHCSGDIAATRKPDAYIGYDHQAPWLSGIALVPMFVHLPMASVNLSHKKARRVAGLANKKPPQIRKSQPIGGKGPGDPTRG